MQLYHTRTGRRGAYDNCRTHEKYIHRHEEKTRMMMTEEKIQTGLLPVMESFYTLQGEGFHQGRAAYFIRLAGCDVGCVWCDVKESWDASSHPLLSIEDIKQ